MTIAIDSKIGQADLTQFAEDHVNLPHRDVVEYRAQVNRLRERLEDHIAEHPHFDVVKMLNSGSVAKGTALRSINDMDVAVYIEAAGAPSDDPALVDWMYDRLREAYPQLDSDQFVKQQHCVTLTFRGTGLDVDVVPVLYEGDANDYGCLIAKDSGDRVRTSIPRHLEFIQARKEQHPHHFRQLVRFAKYWARYRKSHDPGFRMKSFVIELITAKLVDEGLDPANYASALTAFFGYITQTGLQQRISFFDYPESTPKAKATGAPIEIFDPVNGDNNVAQRYSDTERLVIVEAANDAFDAITFARAASTKSEAIAQWRLVFGPEFDA